MKFHWLNREQWLRNEQIDQIYFRKTMPEGGGSERNLWCSATVGLFGAAAVQNSSRRSGYGSEGGTGVFGVGAVEAKASAQRERPLEKA